MGYKITRDGGNVFVAADEQCFTEKDCENLWRKERIYYKRGVFAIMVTERKNTHPLCTLGVEDDGCICFTPISTCFDAGWLDDLIKVAYNTAYKLQNDGNKKGE